MSKVIKWWFDNGANAFSCKKGSFSFDDIGISEEDWESMSETERDEFMQEIAWDGVDWGYVVEESEG